ncbi:hypothetical protein Pmani_011498 [Petrolisthes manimaculis]|uniref:Putative nuclease HARBI1 n=1 Tax=Petrolisthes manimaculis TaxID=1843537 RepID=A0AAE1Q102_9EUCA|nr:hypothetical protein Pmani_011498 [Petrolisthes manimaculis]
MQLCNEDDLGVSQQTVSRVISETVDALCEQHILKRFIKFPPIEQLQKKMEQFREIAGFPEVVGAIDGTHIRIAKPTEFEIEYVNRKMFHGINVQVVFDAKYNIINLEAKWPGSVHDSRIVNESGLKTMFETAKVCKISFVCAILHNICKDRNIQLLLEDEDGHGQPPSEDNLQMADDDDDDNRVEASPAGIKPGSECHTGKSFK